MVERLYMEYYPELLRYAAGMTGSRPAAEDVVQQTFLRALEHLETLQDLSDRQCRAWLYRTARNLFLDGARRDTQRPEEPPAETEDRAFDRMETAQLLELLNERERALFSLRYFAGYDSTELGELFDLSPATVRTRLASARRKLRLIYEQMSEEA